MTSAKNRKINLKLSMILINRYIVKTILMKKKRLRGKGLVKLLLSLRDTLLWSIWIIHWRDRLLRIRITIWIRDIHMDIKLLHYKLWLLSLNILILILRCKINKHWFVRVFSIVTIQVFKPECVPYRICEYDQRRTYLPPHLCSKVSLHKYLISVHLKLKSLTEQMQIFIIIS